MKGGGNLGEAAELRVFGQQKSGFLVVHSVPVETEKRLQAASFCYHGASPNICLSFVQIERGRGLSGSFSQLSFCPVRSPSASGVDPRNRKVSFGLSLYFVRGAFLFPVVPWTHILSRAVT